MTERQCARFSKKNGQCPNLGVVNYAEKIERRGMIFFSLCRKHSPNVLAKDRKEKGDTLYCTRCHGTGLDPDRKNNYGSLTGYCGICNIDLGDFEPAMIELHFKNHKARGEHA